MMLKKKKPKKFVYEPRYSKKEDGTLEKNTRIEFRRIRRRTKPGRSLIWLIILLIVVCITISYLNKIAG